MTLMIPAIQESLIHLFGDSADCQYSDYDLNIPGRRADHVDSYSVTCANIHTNPQFYVDDSTNYCTDLDINFHTGSQPDTNPYHHQYAAVNSYAYGNVDFTTNRNHHAHTVARTHRS